MATIKPFKQTALDAAYSKQKELEAKLSSASSSFSEAPAEGADLATDVQLQTIKKTISNLESQKSKEKWYGTGPGDVTTQGAPKEGIVSKILSGIAAPARAMTGAVEAAIGGGEGRGIIENATRNVLTAKKTYGDLMEERGVSKWVSAPLGFALDVALDPLNWASAGTAALVPRLAEGAVKGVAKEGAIGALKGLQAAAVSSVGGDALGVAKFLPYVKDTELFGKVAGKVAEQGMKYEALAGADQLAKAGTSMFGLTDVREGGFTIGKALEDTIKKIPGGETLIEKFKYSPADYSQKAKALESTFKILKQEGVTSSIPIDLSKVSEMMDNPLNKEFIKDGSGKFSTTLERLADTLKSSIDDTAYVTENGTKKSFLIADGAVDFEVRLAEEAIKDEQVRESIKMFSKLNGQKTGIDFFDTAKKFVHDNVAKFKIGDVALGEKMLTTVDGLNSVFKSSKVMLNPASHMNSRAANVLFTTMYGLDPFDTFLADGGATLGKVKDFLKGKEGADFFLKQFLNDMSDFSRFAAENPNEVINTYGVSASMMGGRSFIDNMVKEGKLMGYITSSESEAELIRRVLKMPDELRIALEDTAGAATRDVSKMSSSEKKIAESLKKSIKGQKEFKQPTPLEAKYQNIIGKTTSEFGESRSMLGSELSDSSVKKYYEVKKEWADKAAQGDIAYKILDNVFNKTVGKFSNEFELIDQSFKMTSALKMTNRGLTETELRAVAKNIKGGITDQDVLWSGYVDGQKRYRLTWNKATDITNDIYMNYAAMPAFARMMRSAPIVGMPFGSFTYGAITKMTKNLVNNPNMINKAEFAMKEFSAQKSPIEKEALNSQYYSWFNSPGMMKLPQLPFFADKPVYLNLTNWIPYYSLNIFSPSERNYAETIPGNIATLIDKVGLFKTPTGQLLWDYGFGPFLATGETPTNQFGTALYPKGATALEKTGYAARSLAESYVPSIIAPAGALVPEKYAQAIPLYQGRKFSEGNAGKNVLGILKANKTPEQIQIENAANFLGIPINTLDLNTLTSTIKKSAKSKK